MFEVACAWEPLVSERESEKRAKYTALKADLARQNPGHIISIVPVVLGDLYQGVAKVLPLKTAKKIIHTIFPYTQMLKKLQCPSQKVHIAI